MTKPPYPTIERRCVAAQIAIRAANPDPEAPTSATVVGYASIFDSPSATATPDFVEIIRPGAFTRTLRENPDVRAFWNHNLDFILGRAKANTLSLEEDAKGLRFELILPDSPTGQDARSAIERGDVDAMSFGFITRKDEMRKDQDGRIVREIFDVDLIEISPVIFPAYEETSAELRSRVEAVRASQVESVDWSRPHRIALRDLELIYRQ